jgi:iron-sulfur cluster repair protein YtfE (RIC family)
MATRLDRIIDRLRKKTKETWKLYEKIKDEYIDYIKFYSTNLHWPTMPYYKIIGIYYELKNMHQELARDMKKLLPDIDYLTRRPEDQDRILDDLERKIRNIQNVQRELDDMENYLFPSEEEEE